MGFDKRGGGENGGKGRFLLLFVFWILNVQTEWWWGEERSEADGYLLSVGMIGCD